MIIVNQKIMDEYDDPPQQGINIECTLCYVINEKVNQNCPDCKGVGSYFRPAQMVDRPSSNRKILRKISELSQILELGEPYENPKQLQKLVFSILQDSQIYAFNLKTSLLELYRKLSIEQT